MKRVNFMTDMNPRGIKLDQLDKGSTIGSHSGLRAKVKESRPEHYVIKVTDGIPRLANRECIYNHTLKQYEIHSSHVHLWKMED